MNNAHTTTDTADELLLLIVMLPIGVLAGIMNWLPPLDRETDWPPIDMDAVTPEGSAMYTYSSPAPNGVNEMETDDEDDAETDTVCGDANVYEPFMTGLNDMFTPPHILIYVCCTIHLHILVLSFELFEQSVVIRGRHLVLLLVCICYRRT
jgi:hypothetical protein